LIQIPELRPLRELLDEHIIGHHEAKDALLLALVCREHIYLEGPPGTAKTLLAELTARGSGLNFFFHQFHRDTRLSELVGDTVLERRPLAAGGEQIHQRTEPGAMLSAEIAVLDDISRAPGEALNVLLRILNEREFAGESLGLLTAIATSNPFEDDYYNEPLDPANLDRFALQLRIEGLLQDASGGSAEELVRHFAASAQPDRVRPAEVVAPGLFDRLHTELAGVSVPESVTDGLLSFVQTLVEEYDCNERNSLLTDRTFLVKAIKLLRGRALLGGRAEVGLQDLGVLGWMTTFRVPSEVHEKVPALLQRLGA
jgi:MoxR-like ATPase